jgi:hypothetical protein
VSWKLCFIAANFLAAMLPIASRQATARRDALSLR